MTIRDTRGPWKANTPFSKVRNSLRGNGEIPRRHAAVTLTESAVSRINGRFSKATFSCVHEKREKLGYFFTRSFRKSQVANMAARTRPLPPLRRPTVRAVKTHRWRAWRNLSAGGRERERASLSDYRRWRDCELVIKFNRSK